MRPLPALTVAAVAAVSLVACGTSGAPMHDAPTAGGGHGDHGASGGMPVGEPADPSEATRIVEVEALDAMAFDPATVEVAAGDVVTFRVTNVGAAVHEFTLGDGSMQRMHADEMGDMGSGMDHHGPNSVTVQPGGTEELTWRFGDAGTVEYACHEPGHYSAGMRGTITVT